MCSLLNYLASSNVAAKFSSARQHHRQHQSTLLVHEPKTNLLHLPHALHHESLHQRRLPPQQPNRPHRSSSRSDDEQILPPHNLDPAPTILPRTHQPTSQTMRHHPRARASPAQSPADALAPTHGHHHPHGLEIRHRMHDGVVPEVDAERVPELEGA